MNDSPPRLRMFAGPNGSGKTTVKNGLRRPPSWFGVYLNPDELEKTVRETGRFSLSDFETHTTTEELQEFLKSSMLLKSRGLGDGAQVIRCSDQAIDFSGLTMNSYYASVVSDFLRRKAIAARQSFSFETVMSSPDKVDLLRLAQGCGYRTYLYFVATEHPDINVERVKLRVSEGGHDVPAEKIVSRYYRSLELLAEAIKVSNRAFIFDTSEDEPKYIAEVIDGTHWELKSGVMPNWFQSLWMKS